MAKVLIDIKDIKTGERLNLKNLWKRVLSKNPQLFSGIEPNGDQKQLTIRADFSDSRRCQLHTNEGPVQVVHIDFQATLWAIKPELFMSQILQYSRSDEGPIAHVVKWDGQDGDIIEQLTFIGVLKKQAT